MADPGFRIVLIASAVVLVLAAIDVVWLIRTRHAAVPTAQRLRDQEPPHPAFRAQVGDNRILTATAITNEP